MKRLLERGRAAKVNTDKLENEINVNTSIIFFQFP